MSLEYKIYKEFVEQYPCLEKLPIWEAHGLLVRCCQNGGKILVCGNGGSAADSEHIVGELMKGFRFKRQLSHREREAFKVIKGGNLLADSLQQGIPAISLNSHTALLTAVGNDMDYRMVFAQQVYGYGKQGDILIAMSTSGNSANVVEAAKTARVLGLGIIGITGEGSSELEEYCDICLKMPAKETYQIQEYTLPLYHALCAMLEERMFGRMSDGEK